MYNVMMDPELIKVAQEQMSRMPPSELAKIQQMMSNPELMKMASETMKNMRPEDLRNAAEQLKYTRPEDMAEIGEKMANATPEELPAMRARAGGQLEYELNAAQMLKKQGNELHSKGRFHDALQKYLLAKKNLKVIPSPKGSELLMACSLNLMSCYLKTRQYAECIKEGFEVLAYDAKNVKALYRRGQAYKELGQLRDAVTDLIKAQEVSPDDETIADVLRLAKERLSEEGGEQPSRGLVIEEITEEVDPTEQVEPVSSPSCSSSSTAYSVIQPHKSSGSSKSMSESNSERPNASSECLQAFKDDPETIRSFQNFMSNADPDTLAALSVGKAGILSPDMFKTASNMVSKMPPEEIQIMLQLASSFQGESPSLGGSSDSSSNGFGPGSVPPNITPDMLKTASDMMSTMSPEELQKMYAMTSYFKGKGSMSMETALNSNAESSDSGSKIAEAEENDAVNRNNVGENSLSRGLHSNWSPLPFNFPPPIADLQEEIRNQMKDPAMLQMFTSMMKNMSPDMMANMGEQFGFKLSQEDTEKAHQAMSSLSPENLDRMMLWADRIQRGVEGVKKTKNWLLGKPGMILAICMLIFAIILHWLGYIDS